MDKKLISKSIAEIKKSKGKPFCMNNEADAEELYPHIKEQFKEAFMLKCGELQWIIVSRKAKRALLKELQVIRNEYMRMWEVTERAMDALEDNLVENNQDTHYSLNMMLRKAYYSKDNQ